MGMTVTCVCVHHSVCAAGSRSLWCAKYIAKYMVDHHGVLNTQLNTW